MRTPLRVGIQYGKVVKIADLALDPLVGIFLNRNTFCFAVYWQIIKNSVVHRISIFLRIKRDVKCILLGAFLNNELQSNFHQLKSSLEKLLKLLYREMYHLLLVNVVEGLEINSLVRYVKETLYLNEWQNPFDFEFSREKTFL